MNSFTTKTGKIIRLRSPQPDDVNAMHVFINTLSQERTFIRFQGENISLEEEQHFVETKLQKIHNKTGIMILAFDGNILIGNAGIDMYDRTERHIGLFGISVAKEYRGEGIGRTLMNTAIEEAKKTITELEILTLSVYANNGKACALYESFGFKRYGMLPNGVKLEHGYADHVYMYKKI